MKYFFFNIYQYHYLWFSSSREGYNMLLLLTIIVVLILIVIIKFVLPILIRHSQLQKEYRNITLLPLSSIPFMGNLHQFDKRPHVFFQSLLRQAKESQDQNKGVFCLWCGIWPTIFLCTGEGLEVREDSIKFSHQFHLF
jgi:hypothetical protein